MDLSQLPPPPIEANQINSQVEPKGAAASIRENTENSMQSEEIPNIELNEEEAKELFKAPPPPSSVIEALQQRLDKYNSTLKQAQQEENASKVRRLGRIVKQYERAIKDYRSGKQVDFDELPAPPGICLFELMIIILVLTKIMKRNARF